MRLSDEILQKTIEKTKGIRQRMSCRHEHNKNVFLALIELKERREADKKALTIKEQLRLVHDKCPDVWEKIDFPDFDCPSQHGFKYHNEDCQGFCVSCYDKALEDEGGQQ